MLVCNVFWSTLQDISGGLLVYHEILQARQDDQSLSPVRGDTAQLVVRHSQHLTVGLVVLRLGEFKSCLVVKRYFSCNSGADSQSKDLSPDRC